MRVGRLMERTWKATGVLKPVWVLGWATVWMAAPATAQVPPPPIQEETEPLEVGPITMGSAGPDAVQDFLGEPLSCQVQNEAVPEMDVPEAHFCRAAHPNQSPRLPEAYFVDREVVYLRYMPVYDGPIETIVDSFEDLTGTPPLEERGEEGMEDLRYWTFSMDRHHVVVAEVRLEGRVRPRIALMVAPSEWLPEPPDDFDGGGAPPPFPDEDGGVVPPPPP